MTDTTTDRAALRDRIAAAIWERQNPGRRWADCEHPWGADAEEDADAVLAVLPPAADRAAVLREAAQRLYTALFPAVYADMGQKAAEGVNRAVSVRRRMADETAATETQPPTAADCNSGPGWYEVITPRATTCIAYVHEDGSLYLPEGDPTEEEFAFAAARGMAHRLVRADEQPGAGARQDEPDHVCNSVQARGEMDEPLGYLICGVCGKPKSEARQDGAQP